MDDLMTVRDSADNKEKAPPAPEGSFACVCVDAIYLGKRVEQFQGHPEKLVEKGALVFQLSEEDETGKRYELSKEFTLSFGEKANLRKFLAAWRGKAYTNEEARDGVPLKKCIGVNGIVSVEHKPAKSTGNLYANILTITPLLKGMPKMTPKDYTRAAFWEARIKEYMDGAEAYMARNGNGKAAPAIDAPLPQEESDDLPF
jgi:hypothetical protein